MRPNPSPCHGCGRDHWKDGRFCSPRCEARVEAAIARNLVRLAARPLPPGASAAGSRPPAATFSGGGRS